MSEHVLDKFFKYDKLPTTLCPGCGNGIVFQALARAIDKLGYSHDEIIVITGVGCSSRACIFMDVTGAQTIHGRPLAFATGAKMTNPKLKVFVVTGDGDATSIGGNHFIHACRRNIDLNVIVCNNSNYGMTGGQYSASTPTGTLTKTSTLGHIESNFDVCKLAEGAGATFVARSTTYHIGQLIDLIVKGAQHKGLSVIDAMCDCPTQYGRFNKLGDAAEMLKRWKDISVSVEQAKNLSKEELKGKIVIGKLYENTELPEFTEEYAGLVSRAKKKEEKI